MKRTYASTLIADAIGLPRTTKTLSFNGNCAACGRIAPQAVPFIPPKTFNDRFLMADRTGTHLCVDCDAVIKDKDASTTIQGCATTREFFRISSNVDRLKFLMEPPDPPFAVAIITAKRQHVWWMTPVTYDRDLIQIQFGRKRLMIDRPKAIAAAKAILAYEQETMRTNKRTTYVFKPLSRELKDPDDGQHTLAFLRDETEAARGVREIVAGLTLGDLWAAMQIRAAVRAAGVETPEEALQACREQA